MTTNWDEPLDFKKEGIVLDYKTAGVDIDAGNEFVKSIPIANKGFGGMFQVPHGYEEPVLVSGTDGVGTKIDIAQAANDYTSIGIDLVAMCVNDIITCGAKPLYFLDYISTKKIDKRLPEIMQGIVKGCEYAGVELIGGETAEHPHYQDKIDLAGFCTGIVEKKKIIDGSAIKPSDVVIGLPSTGLHSNGYSIVNYLARRLKMNYNTWPDLLTPTEIYVPTIQRLLSEMDEVYGMAHITGGGIPENLPRCLPEGLKANIDWNSWSVPEIFLEIQRQGNMDEEEMRRVFNLGIGYCVVVPANRAEFAMSVIRDDTLADCWQIGEIVLE
jgi:phosphoribosylformylglycinamidine cyclo-ligase